MKWAWYVDKLRVNRWLWVGCGGDWCCLWRRRVRVLCWELISWLNLNLCNQAPPVETCKIHFWLPQNFTADAENGNQGNEKKAEIFLSKAWYVLGCILKYLARCLHYGQTKIYKYNNASSVVWPTWRIAENTHCVVWSTWTVAEHRGCVACDQMFYRPDVP